MPKVDYEDALDMYADDFDEKEKARMEQQAEKKKNTGEGSFGVSWTESENPKTGREMGDGIAKLPTSSCQEGNRGNTFAVSVYCV
jgi:hypothetical protein